VLRVLKGSREEGRHVSVLGRAACTFHPSDVDTTLVVAFTDHEVQRNLLIGVVIVVLIERARMRPGG
jgi:hypothetical protein